jgi:hypothetical protein
MRSHDHPSLGGLPSTRRRAGGVSYDAEAAAAVLGAAHPLARVLRAMRTVLEQALALGAALAGGVGLLVTGHAWGLELLLAGALVQSAVSLRLLVLILTRRDVRRDLIIEAGSARGLKILDREWCRLASPRHRERLAHSVERLAAAAARPLPRVRGSRPYFDVRVVRAVGAELREVGALLRCDEASVPGVALAERLLTSPGSPLWAADARALSEELARIRYLLSTHSLTPIPRR